MKSAKQHNKRWQHYLIAFFAILFTAILAGHIFNQDFKQQNVLESFQEVILDKEEQLLFEMNELKKAFEKNPDSLFLFSSRYKRAFIENGFSFYIFKNDKLVFWSDNNLPTNFLSETYQEPVLHSGNAWIRKAAIEDSTLRIIGAYLIKYDYRYQNTYLENSFHHSFNLPCRADLSIENERGDPINSSDGDYLFSITFQPSTSLTQAQYAIVFVLYLTALLLLIGFMYEIYRRIHRYYKRRIFLLAAFVIDLIIIRAVLFFFKIPEIIYDSKLFGPHYYAHSEWIPSLGDLFLNVLFILIIAFVVFYHYKFDERIWKRRPFFRYFFAFSLLLHVFIFFRGVVFIFESLISDSVVSVDLHNIFTLSWMSLLSLTIITVAVLAYLLITAKLTFMAYRSLKKAKHYVAVLVVVFAIWNLFCLLSGGCNWVYSVFVFIFILSYLWFFQKGIFRFSLSAIAVYILLFSTISTYSLHKYNNLKERAERKLLALYLAADQRDPIAEFIFGKTGEQIISDSLLQRKLMNLVENPDGTGEVEEYLLKEYFSEYWRKYNRQVTVCNDLDALLLKPEEFEVNCWEFFSSMVEQSGKATGHSELFFLDFGIADAGYIAILEFDDQGEMPLTRIFIELTPKYVARDLGFPDLLIDREISRSPDLTDYSYAKYENGELQHRVGKYFYNISLRHYGDFKNRVNFIDLHGYNHCIYNIDDSRDLIISLKNKTFLDTIAPFSYLFLFYAVFISVIFLLFIMPFSRRKISYNFRTRLQLSMTAVILFSFLVIGIFTIFYIQNLNAQKNNDILSEKTHSVLVEMQHKLFDEDAIDDYLAPYVSELLIKFSSVFFTDINLFNLDGRLIASSRPQIYDEMLISNMMNPKAFKELTINSSSLFIQQENIGRQNYLSAYIPFINDRNQVIAYLNLPYFAKENDLRREISTFLVAYINIYVILIAITVLIALIISNYISRPIKLIMNKIRAVNLGGQNEKIDWKHDDEIGQLVKAYNRMIDELAVSAGLLARSERESAWREMAKQVAHEIKNPLTPMKLSVQYLQHAWNKKVPDWESRLQKFTQTMIEQIETLSVIATEFSDFAKMPATRKETVNINEVIHNAISLFKNYRNIHISIEMPEDGQLTVFADKDQLLRAFNNLLKNAVQAIGKDKQGTISIKAAEDQHQCIVTIEDNGGGIPDEIAEKIFFPNFTTKSSGMGLGLAIVKSVIVNSGGEISYTSHPGKGTTFIISLPLIKHSE
jgi:two-component system, NtrC family, nitrogen regulation sensor histidine kinase NtrY